MRPVLSVDLICAGRALMKARPNDRRYVSRLLILRANIADYHREQTGLAHPKFGNGTLADAARLFGMTPEPTVCDPHFAAALRDVLQTLIEPLPENHRVSR